MSRRVSCFPDRKVLGLEDLAAVPGLYRLLRRVRAYIPAGSKSEQRQWREQIHVNIPLLYIASLLVQRFAERRNCTTLLFATRDCVHFCRIFSKLFPQFRVCYFQCSRNMMATGGAPYADYVKSVLCAQGDSAAGSLGRTLFVDLHGTGQHALNYFQDHFGAVPYVYVMASKYQRMAQLYPVCREAARAGKLFIQCWNVRASPVELLNYELFGTLQRYCAEKGPIRDIVEYDVQRILPYHDCVHIACSLIAPFPVLVTEELHSVALRLFGQLMQVLRVDKPSVGLHIAHVGNHPVTAGRR